LHEIERFGVGIRERLLAETGDDSAAI